VKYTSQIMLQLNTSHLQWLFFFKSLAIKIQKQKYLVVNLEENRLNKLLKILIKSRPLNIYTRRGLRLSRQKVLKKIGKRSS
jgi:hypothetical protein